jgi:hypothetical protein
MKFLKALLLTLLSAALVLILVLFQLVNTLNGAALSSDNFSRVFDDTFTPDAVGQLVVETIADTGLPMKTGGAEGPPGDGGVPPEIEREMDDFMKQLSAAIDAEWFETEIPELIKGCFAYFTTDAQLPAIDIRPLKEAMTDIYRDRITAHLGTDFREDFESAVEGIERLSGGITKDGEVTEEAVAAMMSAEPFSGLDIERDTAVRILERMDAREADGSDIDEVFSYTVEQVMSGMIGLDGMKDELDMNRLFINMYGAEDNPVSALKELVNGVKGDLFMMLVLMLLLLLCAVAVIAYDPRGIMRWIGVPFIIAGAVCVILSLFPALVNGLITAQAGVAGAEAGLLVQGWALSYIGSISTFMLIQGIVAVFIGIGLAAAAHFARKTPEKRHTAIRSAAAVLLTAAALFTAVYMSQGLGRRVKEFESAAASAEQQDVSVSRALNETIGGSLFGGSGFGDN